MLKALLFRRAFSIIPSNCLKAKKRVGVRLCCPDRRALSEEIEISSR